MGTSVPTQIVSTGRVLAPEVNEFDHSYSLFGARAVSPWFHVFLAIVLGILTSCGGNSPTVPPATGGFSAASLKGQYAFLLTGIDSKGAYFARVGSFTADGAGNITAGVQDALNLSAGQPASVIPFTGGSYNVQANGRGQIVLKFATGELQLVMDLQSAAQGFLVEMGQAAATSGSFHLQRNVREQ